MKLFSWISRLFAHDNTSVPPITVREPKTFTVEDITYPIKQTRNGNYYIMKVSKHGINYRWHIPDKYLKEFYRGENNFINKNSNEQ